MRRAWRKRPGIAAPRGSGQGSVWLALRLLFSSMVVEGVDDGGSYRTAGRVDDVVPQPLHVFRAVGRSMVERRWTAAQEADRLGCAAAENATYRKQQVAAGECEGRVSKLLVSACRVTMICRYGPGP